MKPNGPGPDSGGLGGVSKVSAASSPPSFRANVACVSAVRLLMPQCSTRSISNGYGPSTSFGRCGQSTIFSRVPLRSVRTVPRPMNRRARASTLSITCSAMRWALALSGASDGLIDR
ncbi:hypothetical protein GO283_05108 [Ralstonia solanacearum]|nr:hypothetical protein [Ralstonia solanacearum]NKA76304.1 hypothetical protein [Ralstonia solanacearum]NKA96548.1 hypothetical protein [Ralstonia solanacearum]NKB15538.1 hypothetical protein [Ralstonia solanacearum]NKF82704.1 hypothetical protein [Ralstonia solanacearum]